MTTLATAYALANAYWDSKGGSSRMMAIRARKCSELAGGMKLKLASLDHTSGATLLTKLRSAGYSRASVCSYYAAFRGMLKLSGVSTITWPGPGGVPRKTRDPFPQDDIPKLITWLEQQGYPETADLVRVLDGTGMRVDVEALDWDAWVFAGEDAIRITGKGQHERIVPVTADVATLLSDRDRIGAMRRLCYSTHLKRWAQGVKALGITTRKPTPHSIRHRYATRAYSRCRDLLKVRDLMGHADVNTTASYIGIDQAELRQAAGADL